MMEHLMQNEQVEREHISGWWRRVWTAIRNFADAIETSPTDYMFDRISHLEREVASLKSELQRGPHACERHHS
jgi:polyhydroxyalkanoate synthesis regulator phasin